MKIQIGTTNKKYKHNARITANTTANFGGVQPIFCRKLHARDSISMNINQFVRLMPMPYPTLADVNLKTKAVFIPIGDIAQPYDNYLSQTNYQFTLGKYIPTALPRFSMNTIMTYILNQSDYAFSQSFTYKPGTGGLPVVDGVRPDKPLGSSSSSSGMVGSGTLTPNTPAYHDDILIAMYEAIGLTDHTGIYSSVANAGDDGFVDLVAADVTPQNCDFILFVNTDGTLGTFSTGDTTGTAAQCVCYRLTQLGSILIKALRGLGYSCNPADNERVNFLPVVAYCKALYDSFGIQRDKSYTDTELYANIKNMSDTYSIWQGSQENPVSANALMASFLEFIADYSWCTLPTDFISAHTLTAYGSNSELIPNDPTSNSSGNTVYPATETYSSASTGTPVLANASLGIQPLTSIQLQLLQRVTSLFAQDSVIGKNIKRYIQNRYGADISNQIYDTAYNCGDIFTPIQISDINSTADTTGSDGSQLGSYAGKGVGSGNGKLSVSDVATDGYFIVFQWIEPNENYFQGMATELYYVTAPDEARPEYDALGYEVTRQGAISDLNDVGAKNFNPSASFGFIPRYSGWKNYRNLVNGDLRLRRYGSDMQCFYLDKYIKTFDYTYDVDSKDLKTGYHQTPVAGDQWRFLGKYPWMQSFNRIFYNNAEYGDAPYTQGAYNGMKNDHVPDNFIIHNVISLVETNKLKPISNSYDTFIDEVNNGSTDISQS